MLGVMIASRSAYGLQRHVVNLSAVCAALKWFRLRVGGPLMLESTVSYIDWIRRLQLL